jgi:glucuronate isomerase
MKPFMDENFLLSSRTAERLYHEYAAEMPIIDYHCHINPAEICEDRRFENIAQAWLGGDHYKWRLMRCCGVDEFYVTGNATDREKFQKFAECLPKAIGNPLYHWAHLELRRYFDYHGVLNGSTAQQVWDWCNERLSDPSMTVRGIIERSNVRVIGTTDDPADDLHWHARLCKEMDFATRVVPTFRPDKAVNIEKDGFLEEIAALSAVSGEEIQDFAGLLRVFRMRLDDFDALGCRASDHGLDAVVYRPAGEAEVAEIFARALCGQAVTAEEAEKYKTALLLFFGTEYRKRGWVMQLHYGALRNTNTSMFRRLGPDTGFDCINAANCAHQLAALLDALALEDALPKTVLYSLNGQDNEMLVALAGCFQSPEAFGKIQHGSAWWFNDTKSGMEAQLQNLANLGALGNFIGMLTDSRSFLSYTRHEYFRRILCNLIGVWVENGEYPDDLPGLGRLVQDICYYNAKAYFGF